MVSTTLKKIYWTFYDFKSLFFNLFAKVQAKSIGKNCKFHRFCKLTSTTEIGENCHFNGISIQGKGRVIIGNNFHSGIGVHILTSDHNYDYGSAVPYDNTYVTDDVIIGDNVWIGMNVIILKGVRLGDGCIVQAGSVVSTDIPSCAIAGGHPAKQFKERDKKRYYELASQKRFY